MNNKSNESINVIIFFQCQRQSKFLTNWIFSPIHFQVDGNMCLIYY